MDFFEKKGALFRGLKMLFPDAIRKIRFRRTTIDLYLFFFRFIVFWHLNLCPGDFDGVFCGFRMFFETYFCFSGTFFGKGGARVIFQPFSVVLRRQETGRFGASAVMLIFATYYSPAVFHEAKIRVF